MTVIYTVVHNYQTRLLKSVQLCCWTLFVCKKINCFSFW